MGGVTAGEPVAETTSSLEGGYSGSELMARIRAELPGLHPNVFPNVWGVSGADVQVLERVRADGFACLSEVDGFPGVRAVDVGGDLGRLGVCHWSGWWLSFLLEDTASVARVRVLGRAASTGSEEEGRLLLGPFVGAAPLTVQAALEAWLMERVRGCGPGPGSGPGAELGSESVPGLSLESGAGPGAGSGSEPAPGPEPGARVGILGWARGPGRARRPGQGSEPGLSPEPGAGPETGSRVRTRAESGVRGGPGDRVGVRTRAEPGVRGGPGDRVKGIRTRAESGARGGPGDRVKVRTRAEPGVRGGPRDRVGVEPESSSRPGTDLAGGPPKGPEEEPEARMPPVSAVGQGSGVHEPPEGGVDSSGGAPEGISGDEAGKAEAAAARDSSGALQTGWVGGERGRVGEGREGIGEQ